MTVSSFYERRREGHPVSAERRLFKRRSQLQTLSEERRRLASRVRRYERALFRIPVRFTHRTPDCLGETHDIGSEGLRISTDTALSSGTPLALSFSFGDRACLLNLSGRVAYCLSNETGGAIRQTIGVAFSSPRSLEENILAAIIREADKNPMTQEQSFLRIQVLSESSVRKESVGGGENSPALEQDIRGLPSPRSEAAYVEKSETASSNVGGVCFELTKEQKLLQDSVRAFAQREIVPVAAEHDRTGAFPWGVLQNAFKLGIFGSHIPKEYGGGGLGLFETALISEEIGAACTGMMTSIMVNVLATGPLLLAGTPEQKRKYLSQCCQRLTLFSFCFTEPDAGSDPSRMATTAELRGDHYVLNGSKCFITNSGVADYLVVFATIDKSLKTGGITAFIVPSTTDGVRIGKTLDKMGQRASNTAEIVFENVRVPQEDRIGGEGKGFKIGLLSLARSRVNVAAGGVGLARTALELAMKRVNARVQFNKPLVNFQYVQFRLSDIARDIEAGRLLAWKAAFLHDHGRGYAKESSMAKDFCADLAMRASSDTLDLFGGYGYSRDFPMEKMMRDAKLLQIYEGPTPIHKIIIYRELAREQGFETLA